MKKGKFEKGGGCVVREGRGGMSRGRDEQGEGGDEQGEGGVSLTSIIMHNKSCLGGCRLRGVWVGG